MPAATINGTAFVAVLYLAATLAVLWLLPSAIAAASPTPIADAIAPSLGASARTVVALVGAVSAFGTCNALILLAVETARALAFAGDLPQSFAATDSNGVARHGLIASIVLAMLMVVGSMSENFLATFNFVALVSAVGALVLYLACAAAAWRLRRRRSGDRGTGTDLFGCDVLGIGRRSGTVGGAARRLPGCRSAGSAGGPPERPKAPSPSPSPSAPALPCGCARRSGRCPSSGWWS